MTKLQIEIVREETIVDGPQVRRMGNRKSRRIAKLEITELVDEYNNLIAVYHFAGA